MNRFLSLLVLLPLITLLLAACSTKNYYINPAIIQINSCEPIEQAL